MKKANHSQLNKLDKDRTIIKVLNKLYDRFGVEAFDIVDHWSGDHLAVGIANSQNHSILAYISTRNKPAGHYFVELELPPDPNIDSLYEVAGSFKLLDFEELARIIGNHLKLENRQ